jgi:hypothetical protein
MQKKKLPVGLVVAFGVLLAVGLFVNAGEALKTAGINLGKKPEPPKELKGQQLSEEEEQKQREAMMTARASRQKDGDVKDPNANPDKPVLLIEPEVGNFKQSYNASQTSGQWWNEDSYVEKLKEDSEKNRHNDSTAP